MNSQGDDIELQHYCKWMTSWAAVYMLDPLFPCQRDIYKRVQEPKNGLNLKLKK